MKHRLLLVALLAVATARAATPCAATEFTVLGVSSAFLYDINNAGSMVGYAVIAQGGTDAGQAVGTPADCSTVQWTGGLATYAEGINSAGVAVGAYLGADDNWRAPIFNPVPEPSTYALMLGGLDLRAVRARRSA